MLVEFVDKVIASGKRELGLRALGTALTAISIYGMYDGSAGYGESYVDPHSGITMFRSYDLRKLTAYDWARRGEFTLSLFTGVLGVATVTTSLASRRSLL